MPNDRDQLWLIPRSGETRTQRVAEVALRLRTNRLFSYAIPDDLAAVVQPGVAVRVPHSRRRKLIDGWCVRVSELAWDSTREPIAEVTNPHVLLTPALIEVALWVSEYYVCPPGIVLEAMTPARLREARTRRRVPAAGVRERSGRECGRAAGDDPSRPDRAISADRAGRTRCRG